MSLPSFLFDSGGGGLSVDAGGKSGVRDNVATGGAFYAGSVNLGNDGLTNVTMAAVAVVAGFLIYKAVK